MKTCSKCEKPMMMQTVKGGKDICMVCFSGKSLKMHYAASNLPHERGWDGHFSGYVIAPSYATWVNRLIDRPMPYMVDNGAWRDAWQGEEVSTDEMLQRTLELCERVIESGSTVRFMVLPDTVGSWSKTMKRLNELNDLAYKNYNLALPIQDGFQIDEVKMLIERFNPKFLFIGGSGLPFKRMAVEELNHLGIPFHVGKIHKLEDLCHFSKIPLVESVDSSAFSRPQSEVILRNLGYRLEAYEAWLNGSQRTLKEWF